MSVQIFSAAFALTLILMSGCAVPGATQNAPPPTYADYFDRLPCVKRVGRCFDAAIGGQPVEVIADQTRFSRLRQQISGLNSNVRDVYWEVRNPIGGQAAMRIATRSNDFGLPHLGEAAEEADVTIYPLDGQAIASRTEKIADSSVRVNGHAVVTAQEVATSDALPPGRYVFAVKHIGELNWDRKWILLTVRR
jgi:hypothetical protein